jgi:hypothetical protein
MAGSGNAAEPSQFYFVMWDIGGALLLSIGLGFPAAFLTGRIRKGEPMLTEALGSVFFEIIGPVFTRMALRKSDDSPSSDTT